MIKLQSISKSYTTPNGTFQAVAPTSLHVEPGDVYGIIGFSGAGKSTLLRLVNLLERPDEGKVYVDGQELTGLSNRELRKARQSIGMIFQHFNLLNNRTVADNVAFPLEIAGLPKEERKKRVQECLEIVGLAEKVDSYPAKLSGGQKQRVAIARALASRPKVLLCDEPTSALDPQTTRTILSFLKEINQKLGVTILIVTHEMSVVKEICNKVAVMERGHLVEKLSLSEREVKPKTEIAQLLFEEETGKERGIANV
ncbi:MULTISPECIES: methionine ABC transporter ATP-binding protein [Aneurinibacillus]|jgi:D-methionine transport system ATP-binding protein|uniref:ATP-binding cassette domain-containing protein n=1 Tax=Aneurinibacillus thermoaerophilus TaxID=143495 RepID=A0A1G7WVZ7_ANETH|nr:MULTISPECIES: ATP-binding cassette domain-containing protein [Aneurinibacillus]AMA73926.1 ABC transporter ATP-binding protein [Aneurinibacillus sp. XH2]MED0674110.1 ATP-binding cassette domain-containing protein [Aneurinibacillus thermoaerophilus]MED0678104.1 ATP-binding cassette domain-containing protein [Aneurinibacillus thermoaerophilus]MED0737709.1 ATP-binding cassette domain-containing protein [Aneurinibacillus thermoaerophilus]MED0755701.1 ATP-binding cassette domain-containing protei